MHQHKATLMLNTMLFSLFLTSLLLTPTIVSTTPTSTSNFPAGPFQYPAGSSLIPSTTETPTACPAQHIPIPGLWTSMFPSAPNPTATNLPDPLTGCEMDCLLTPECMQAADIWYQCTDGIPGAKTANNPISLSKNNTNTWECLCGTAMSPFPNDLTTCTSCLSAALFLAHPPTANDRNLLGPYGLQATLATQYQLYCENVDEKSSSLFEFMYMGELITREFGGNILFWNFTYDEGNWM